MNSVKSVTNVKKIQMRALAVTGATLFAVGGLFFSGSPVAGQASGYKAPRTPDGKPNLNGIWQANNTANWDIQGHAARQGPVLELGAVFSIPAGLGVVDGDDIPYQPWAAAKRRRTPRTG